MNIFDKIERNDSSPARYSESRADFLNRSARESISRIRKLTEQWFSRYPQTAKDELRSRFRSKIDRQHYSAFFELFLHELFLRLGCNVVVHPRLSSSSNCPDFLVVGPDGTRVYVEAILATEKSDAAAAADARTGVIYDAINSLESPFFFIGVDVQGFPKTPPSAKHICSYLQKKLGSLDVDEVNNIQLAGSLDDLPHWHYEHDGLELDFFPIPKSPSGRNREGVRTLGIQSPEAEWVDSCQAIRKAVLAKANRYGSLDAPLIIAVNALGDFVDNTDIVSALFGQEEFTLKKTNHGMIVQHVSRKRDGAFGTSKMPRSKRVSSVFVASQIFPWNIPNANFARFDNPWSNAPIRCEWFQMPTVRFQDGQLVQSEGKTLSELFGLPHNWPQLESD